MNKCLLLFILVSLNAVSFASYNISTTPDVAYRSFIQALISKNHVAANSLIHPECKISLNEFLVGFEKYFNKKWNVDLYKTNINDFEFKILSQSDEMAKVNFIYRGNPSNDPADFSKIGESWYLIDM